MMNWIDNLFYKGFCSIGLHFPIHAEWMYPEDLICEYCQKYLGTGNYAMILRWKVAEGTPMELLWRKGPVIWHEAEFK